MDDRAKREVEDKDLKMEELEEEEGVKGGEAAVEDESENVANEEQEVTSEEEIDEY